MPNNQCSYCDAELENEDELCPYCQENTSTCDNCGERYDNGDLNYVDGSELCQRCQEQCRQERPEFRNYSTISPIFLAGRTIKNNRSFGFEIEVYTPNKENAVEISKNLPKGFGLGRDNSIKPDIDARNNNGVGLEIRSPVLRGKIGEEKIKEVCRLLRKTAKINHTCGLHIHIGADDLNQNTTKIKNIMLMYYIFDDVIMSMLPKYRRKNKFAKSLKNGYSLEQIIDADSLRKFEKLWYKSENGEMVDYRKGDRYNQTRYYGFNLHNLLSERLPTIEIRFHSPTLSPTKIINWIAFHQKLISIAIRFKTPEIIKNANFIFFEDKMKSLFALLDDKKLVDYVEKRIKLFNPSVAHYFLKEKEKCAV